MTSSEANIDPHNPPKILYLSYNPDNTCINCGTDSGFIIFNVNPLKPRYHRDFGGGIGIVEVLKTSNILMLVGGGSHPKFPVNKVVVWDDYKSQIITDIQTSYKILGVKFTKECIAVVCKNSVSLYRFENLKYIECIDTCDNNEGLCSLSNATENPVVIVPGKEPGTVTILNYKTKISKTMKCHENMIKTITLNSNSTKFATTSAIGTLVRIFDVQTHAKMQELRRGSDSCEIYSVNFSKDSSSLVTTSSKNTVHLYSLCKDVKNKRSNLRAIGGMLSTYFQSEWSLLDVEWTTPQVVAETGDEPKELDEMLNKHIAAIPVVNERDGHYKLFIVGYDGRFTTYSFELTKSKSSSGQKARKIEKLQSGNLFQLFERLNIENDDIQDEES
jgi:WD40 repeat protein